MHVYLPRGAGGEVSAVGATGEQAAATVVATADAAPKSRGDDASRPVAWDDAEPLATVPAWAADAVFYPIFPEWFRNSDPRNDPTRTSLEAPESVPDSWAILPWTGDWYARSAWEQQLGHSFYEIGVFHRRYGGDLQGVLDYLQELGVNTQFFNPAFYGRALQKCDAASMHHIDPYFGPDSAGDWERIAAATSDPQS